ncbi:MAG: LysM peptidoglycan-binding domain-containing protein [Caldilineaceae bacterium]
MLAVERLEAGEALEVVLADFAEERDELREMLTIVAATHHLQEIDIPRPSAERRASAKGAFLQAAMAMKPEQGTAPGVSNASVAADVPVAANSPAIARARQTRAVPTITQPTLMERVSTFWADLQRSFTPSTVRLAPLIIMLIAVWLGAFSMVSAAQAAIPGDVVYPAKTWMLNQELALSAPADRPEVYDRIIQTLKVDTERAKERAAAEGKIIPTENTLMLQAWGQNNVYVGDLDILTAYQPAVGSQEMLPMTVTGNPVPGDLVRVVYQVVPVTDAQNGVVTSALQGISLTKIENPVAIAITPEPPTATPTPTTTSTLTPLPCVALLPAGWTSYQVQTGDTLSAIARRSGTNITTLGEVNCLANNNIINVGQTLYIPRAIVVVTPELSTPALTTTPIPGLELTLTAISTVQPAVEITPTVVITSTPAIDETVTPTIVVTDTMTASPTMATTAVAITSTVVATASVSPLVHLLRPRLRRQQPRLSPLS